MIVLILVAVGLAATLVIQPRFSMIVALGFPLAQAFFSPPLLRVLVLLLLCAVLLAVLRGATPAQRHLLGWLWVSVALILILGWALAPEPGLAQGVVVNLLYTSAVASLAVVFRATGSELSLYLMAWGCFVSAWLVTQDIVDTGRTGAVYIGENANTLGMFAALGFVGTFVLITRLPFRLPIGVVLTPLGALCLLGVLSSASRGSLVVVAAGVGIRLLAPLMRASALRACATVMVLALGVLWVSVPVLTWFLKQAGRQIQATSDFAGRQQILVAGVRTGFDHFLTGAGFGSLEVSDIGLQGTVSAHNAFVGLFAAVGIIPTLLLSLLMLWAIQRARLSPDRAMLPLIGAAIAVGLSLDWVPTAKLGPAVLTVIVCGAALPRVTVTAPTGSGNESAAGSCAATSKKALT